MSVPSLQQAHPEGDRHLIEESEELKVWLVVVAMVTVTMYVILGAESGSPGGADGGTVHTHPPTGPGIHTSLPPV